MRSGGKLFRSFVALTLCASMLAGTATEGVAARQPEAKDSTSQGESFEQPGEAGGSLEEDANQEKPAGKPGINESNPDEAELGEPVVVGEYYKIYRMDETHYRKTARWRLRTSWRTAALTGR